MEALRKSVATGRCRPNGVFSESSDESSRAVCLGTPQIGTRVFPSVCLGRHAFFSLKKTPPLHKKKTTRENMFVLQKEPPPHMSPHGFTLPGQVGRPKLTPTAVASPGRECARHQEGREFGIPVPSSTESLKNFTVVGNKESSVVRTSYCFWQTITVAGKQNKALVSLENKQHKLNFHRFWATNGCFFVCSF